MTKIRKNNYYEIIPEPYKLPLHTTCIKIYNERGNDILIKYIPKNEVNKILYEIPIDIILHIKLEVSVFNKKSGKFNNKGICYLWNVL